MTNLTHETLFSIETQPENERLALLKQHFPNCFDKNGSFLSEKMAEELHTKGVAMQKEGYSLNWLGKSYAKVLRDTPPETLLAEDVAHNQQPENQNSENLLIKGDNLEVLKHLKHAYKNQIKMIYIDPPYNTGSDSFVYQDDRKFTPQQLAQLGGMDLDEAKRVLEFTAKKSNSHSAWLTFMYPRLYVARELLRDDGVIFISIDDNEQAQLKILCDEVFGEENFVTTLHIELSATQGMKVKAAKEGNIVKNAEYILVYSMDKKNNISHNLLYDSRVDYDSHYNKIIENGMLVNLKEYFIDNIEPVFRNENIQDLYVKSREFRKCIENNLSRIVADDKITGFDETEFSPNQILEVSKNGKNYLIFHNGKKLRQLLRLSDSYGYCNDFKESFGLRKIRGDWWAGFYLDMGNVSKEGNMPYPNGKKPIRLIKQLAYMVTEKDDLILDFFAGSGTTAHAIMQLNTEDLGNRKYILVQLPENLDNLLKQATGEERKSIQKLIDILDEVKRPHLISEITQERIIRSVKQIQAEHPDYSGDFGFKIFQTEPNFQAALDADFCPTQAEIPDSKNAMLSDEQLHTLLTTWRVYDGCRLPEKVQTIDLAGYTAYYCRNHLYLLASGFHSECVKALIEKLDNDKDFVPERIVLFSANMDSAMQKELAQAVKTYANKKGLNNLSVLARS